MFFTHAYKTVLVKYFWSWIISILKEKNKKKTIDFDHLNYDLEILFGEIEGSPFYMNKMRDTADDLRLTGTICDNQLNCN